MDQLQLNKLQNSLLNKELRIVILTHVNPDGDAMGSSLALFHYLKYAGHKQVEVITPNQYASFLHWLPGSEEVIVAELQAQRARKLIEQADLMFCLDFNSLERTRDLQAYIANSQAKRVLIDHHPQPESDFDYIFSQVEASSTAELVHQFITQSGHQHLMDQKIAECIYTGIITDTGSFSYSCNRPETYLITAQLLQLGVDGQHIHRLIYDTYSEDRMRLLGHCLSNQLKVLKPYKAAYISLSQRDLLRFNYQEGDIEGVVNYALSIQDVVLAAIFVERKDNIKISFRSKGRVNVNTMARKYFHGGGHQNAAGGHYKDTLENALHYFESIIIDQHHNDYALFQEEPVRS